MQHRSVQRIIFQDKEKRRFDIPNIPNHIVLESAAQCTNNFASVGCIDMYENIIRDNVDSFHRKGMSNTVVEETMKAITDSNSLKFLMNVCRASGMRKRLVCGTVGAAVACHIQGLSRDVNDYLMVLAMRLIFTLVTDEDGDDMIISISDTALLTLVRTLKIYWKYPAKL